MKYALLFLEIDAPNKWEIFTRIRSLKCVIYSDMLSESYDTVVKVRSPNIEGLQKAIEVVESVPCVTVVNTINIATR